MYKDEYQLFFPMTGESNQVLVNPAHLQQMCAASLAMSDQTMVNVKNTHGETILIALYEDHAFKFYKKASTF